MPTRDAPARRTQADRRAASRGALLEAAARGIARQGYAALSLEGVAREAGYTRGALYHQFADKQALALAVVEWVQAGWEAEVGHLLADEGDPEAALLRVARAHAVYCREEVARTVLVLQVEFPDVEHPIGRALRDGLERLLEQVTALVTRAQEDGTVPGEPPATEVALAVIGVLESVVINLSGHAPYDEVLSERAVRGVLGLSGHG